jgi:hypothetical protein
MTDVIGLPVWMIGFFALVILVLMAIAVARAGSAHTLGLFGQVAGLALVVGVAWLYLDRLSEQDRGAYRQNIEARLSALTAQSLLPNSHLACLDAAAEDLVQEACEKALYSSPEQVSAALTFIGARLDILHDIAMLPEPEEAAYDKLRVPLLRTLQADRYGLVAQVLQGRDSCTADKCAAFDFLKQREQLVANMKDRAYETRLTKHAVSWSDKPAPALAAAAPAPQPPAPLPPKESQLNLNFPSSASIPPVSIMANEPGMPGQNGVDAPPKPEAKQPPAAAQAPAKKQPQKAAAQPKQRPAAPAAPAAPAQEGQADPFPQPVAPAAQTTGGPGAPRPQ